MKQDEYEKQALEFLEQTGTEFKAEFDRHGYYFPKDKNKRDVYNITLKKGEREYTFTFGQSLNDSGYKEALRGRVLYRKDGEACRELLHAKAAFKELYGYYPQKGQIVAPVMPSAYDVLSCLQKYPEENFYYFCTDYGYDEDSRTAKKIYNAVCEEYANLERLYNDEELDMLREIQ